MPRRRYSEADLRAMIPLYLDGALDPQEREAVEAYWAAHPELIAQFAESTRLIDILDEAVTAPPAPADLTGQVMQRVERLGRLGKLRQTLSLNPPLARIRWFAEATMLVLLGWLLVAHPWAPSVESVELQMHGSATWTASRPVSLRLVARDRAGDKPLVSGDVSIRLQGGRWRQTIFRGRTNEQGTVDATLHLPDRLANGRYLVVAEVEAPVGRAITWHEVDLRDEPRVTLTPLTPTVAAGGELVARVEAREADGTPSAQPVDWRLTDRDGRWLAGGHATELPGGQGFIKAPIDATATVGGATLWAGIGGRMVPAAVAIAPPVRQDLNLQLATDAEAVRRGEPVRGEARLLTAGGAPIAGAMVTARLSEGKAGPVTRTVVTDAAGSASFSLPSRRLPAGPAVLSATATLADERSATAVRRLVLQPGRTAIELAASDGAVGGLQNRVYLVAARAGEPWHGTAHLTLNGAALSPVIVRHGRAMLRLTPRTGWNKLTVRLERDGEREAAQTLSFRAADPRHSLRVETLSSEVSPGADVTVRVAAAQHLNRAYLDLVQRGELLATRSVTAAGGLGRLVFRLPANVSGDVTLVAYALQGSRWLTGQTPLQITPTAADLRLAAGGAGPLEITAPPDAALLVAAIRPPRHDSPAPAPATPAMRGYTLTANSVPAAQRRALQAQRQFFDHSDTFGGVLAVLILVALTAWAYEQLTDPFEWMNRHERRRYGRVPQVHRRGAWAGFGALLAGVALATVVSGGLLLAGRQARELASQTGRAAQFTGPPVFAPGVRSAALTRAMLRQARPAQPAPDLATETRCYAPGTAPELPAQPAATWQVIAFAAPAEGPTASASLTTTVVGQPEVLLRAPAELRIGELVTVPVVVANPTADRLPLAVTTTVTSGLELTVAPTQRVIVEPRAELRLAIGLRAAEYGASRLVVEAVGKPVSARAEATVMVLPDAPRVVLLSSGWIDRDTDLALSFPPGASARRVQVECLQEPLAIWFDALHAAAERPATGPFDLASAADAEALALRLGRRSERLSPERDAALVARVQRAMQRLVYAELRGPDGRLSGAFAATDGGGPDLFATSYALLVLRRIDNHTPVDPRLLARSRAWLRHAVEAALHDTASQPLAEQSDSPSPAALAAAALALTNGDDTEQATVDAVLDDLQSRVGLLPDTASLAWVAAGLSYQRPRAAATAEVLKRLVALRNRRPDGSNWYPGAQATPAGATGRGAGLEVTALVVAALGQSGRYDTVRDEGLAYLAAQQLSDGTWGDAYLTAQVVRAQMAAGELPGAARGFVSATLDDDGLGRATFDGASADLVLQAVPEAGDHVLRLRFLGRGRAAYRVRTAYTLSGPQEVAAGLVARVEAPALQTAPGGRLEFRLTVANPAPVTVSGIVAELPVPAGLALADSPEAPDLLQLPIGALPPGGSRTVTFKLRASADAAQLTGRPVTVRAMLDPGRTATARLPGLRIS